jgi:hypothetical protein
LYNRPGLYENASPFGGPRRGIRLHLSLEIPRRRVSRSRSGSALTRTPEKSGMRPPSPESRPGISRRQATTSRINWHCESRAAPLIHNAETRRRKVNEIVPLPGEREESDLSRERERERERERNLFSPPSPVRPIHLQRSAPA